MLWYSSAVVLIRLLSDYMITQHRITCKSSLRLKMCVAHCQLKDMKNTVAKPKNEKYIWVLRDDII